MERAWWKEAVVYQIYPRSFYDSNGDGIGDLPGIIQKLDYIHDLGVDVILLTPIFATSGHDDGYDISSYRDIQKEFGTLDDFYMLLRKAHSIGIRVMLNMVVNSTSTEHEWYQSARISRRSSKRDFYIWGTPNWGEPPNNWHSYYDASAWSYDEKAGQSYLHLFSEQQPELNWENYKMRQEIYAAIKWWLDMGVDGVHLSSLHLLTKPDGLPDAPESDLRPGWMAKPRSYSNLPQTHSYLREMRNKIFNKYDVAVAGEVRGITVEQAQDYSGRDNGELDIVFQDEHLRADYGPNGRYDPQSLALYQLKHILSGWQTGLRKNGWQAIYFGDSNEPRMVSRFGDDSPEYRERSAKMLATILLTLRGTPFLYQGDEIGMTSCTFSEIEECRDLESREYYDQFMREEDAKPSRAMNIISSRGKDGAHTPMQWGISRSGGFTTGEPWIKANPNHVRLNVSLNESDEYSVLNYYRKAIALRKQNKTLIYGKYVPLDDMNSQHYSYLRTDNDGTFLIFLNFTRGRILCTIPLVLRGKSVESVLSNYEKEDAQDDNERLQQYVSSLFHPNKKHEEGRFFRLEEELQLRPYEAVVLKIL